MVMCRQIVDTRKRINAVPAIATITGTNGTMSAICHHLNFGFGFAVFMSR
jgi:hypothetical protein